MRYLICILLVLLLLLSCYQRKREIEIALTPVTLPDSILSIYDLDVKQDHIYLLDRDRFSLWVLSHRDGLIREINLWRGKGPGEFIMPVDLAVDGQRIFVLDDMLQRVTYMDTSGLFISSFQIGFRAFKIYARNDSVYVLGVDPETKKSVHVFNLKGQKLASFIPVFAVLPQYRTYYQGIGLSLFSPADWFVKGDTIWVANRFLYEIKAYKKDREIITIRGDDKLIHKPDISTKVGKRTYVVAMQIYCYTRIAVVDTLLYVAIFGLYSNPDKSPPDLRNYLQIFDLRTGKLIAERFEVHRSNTPTFFDYYDGFFYFIAGYNELFQGDIRIK